MIYISKSPVTLEINSVQDLTKLGAFMKDNNLKVNKSAIARSLNINRRTVNKYLYGFQKSEHRIKPSSLDKYGNIIENLLASDIQVFSYRSILYRYLCDNHDLNVPESTFYHYLKRHPEYDDYFRIGKISNSASNPIIRFETKPGYQAQLDWKESIDFVLKDTGEVINVNVLALVFSHSRYRVFALSLNKSRETLIHLLSEIFDMVGGVPTEIVTDNMKTIMDKPRTTYDKGAVNKTFESFSHDYGFEIKPCIAATPKTKGKVETQMKFLDEIRAYSGKLTFTELVSLIEKINTRINNSIHKGTGKIPVIEFSKEREMLLPLPNENICKQYKIPYKEVKVNTASMISIKSNLYSVPKEYIGKHVLYYIIENRIYIYFNHRLISVHDVTNQKLNYHQEHYVDIFNTHFVGVNKDEILTMAKHNLDVIGGQFNYE